MATKQETQIETVKMDDGRIVDFPGKRQILKSSVIDEQSGTVAVRLDFRNGETRLFTIPGELLLQFASSDERVNASWPPYQAALDRAGVKYTAHVYPDTQHGFHNDTTPRYDAEAAVLAWQRTMELFERVLRG